MSLLFTQSTFALSQVSASVDKNPVMLKESFILQIVADDDVNTNALDTSSLLQNFIVGRTSVSSQTSMINFKTSKTTTWTTVLIPRAEGTFVIPSISIDKYQTDPIKISVLSANNPNANQQQDIFITTDVSAKSVYVQQQITLTVKLHFATELKRGSLTEPSLEGASITQIGKDNEDDAIINGRRYRVIERTYAISPQKSGEFVLKSPLFSGEIIVPSTRRSNFMSFSESKPVSVIGEELSLTVLPIPEQYQGTWLPSELLAIHQEWQPSTDSFVVGEPITRTITLTAAGLSEEQLPEISMQAPAGLKVYPDQAELHSGINNNQLVSQKVKNFAIVASKAGSYELPEMVIPWWNTVTNKYQQAIIPAQKITVLPNSNINNKMNTPKQPITTDEQSPSKTIIIEKSSWLTWLFLSLWLLTSFAWFITSRMNKEPSVVNIKPTINEDNVYLALTSACKKNNGEQVLALICPWINSLQRGKPISTLDEAIKQLNNLSFSEAIHELQECYYSKSDHDWQGKRLLAAISSINNSPDTPEVELLSLNP